MTNELPLTGRTALVTGGGRGIGRAAAIALARAGARVAVAARTAAEVEGVAKEIGGWALPCDVSDPGQVDALVERFHQLAGGAPDVLVASAGVFSLQPVEEITAAELDRHLSVNLRGSVHLVRAFLPALKERGEGVIVQVGSVAGRKAFPGNGAYSASKFGVRGFHEVLLEELRGTGVRATLLEPAATDTSIWDPLEPDSDPSLPGRSGMLGAEHVADAILFVATRPPGVQIPFLPIERG